MEFNKLVFAGLSVGCLAAAAGGSYLANRQNQSAFTHQESGELRRDPAAAASGGLDGSATATKAVTESEGVIAPDASKPEAARPAAPAETAHPASRIVTAPPTRRAEAKPAPSTPSRAPESRRPESQVASGSTAPSTPSTSGSMWETRPSVQPSAPEYKEAEPPAPPPPP